MIFRSSYRSCSMKISVLKNFTKFIGKYLCQSLFSCEFWEIFKNNFFTEHLRWTPSGYQRVYREGRKLNHTPLLHGFRAKKFRFMNVDRVLFSMRHSVRFNKVKNVQIRSFFWSVFSCIRTEYGEIRSISPYSVRMQENTD